MEKVFEKIKTFFDSEAGLKISKNDTNEKCVVDNRFDLIKKCIDSTENKDDDFYSNLIELISIYIDKLYDVKIEDFPNIVFDQNGNLLPQNYNELDSNDIFKLEKANQNLSENLFNYVCSILKTNKDIKLNVETLTRLLNRNPKPFTVSVEDSYLYRFFDYKKLVELINDNEIFKKSNISVDDIYQILINAYQIDNEEVFGCLIKTEQFKENNMKVK